MRLKHIKLAGFKSFVDPTKVPFEQQMTAIVGPNGCGKSNIIDAVRWVLGESSAKNLRGDAMTDVIFNGASTRKPVGQASVELLFDNTSGKITGSMADRNQVSIRRVVNRDSQNSYYLNGTKCRRKDITDIFLGTGLGPRSYAIIEQGTISRLIESKPQELRVFIEEAAGISKYKERRKDTENRIRHTRENLARLADIRIELEHQIEKLHQQAEAAKRFKMLKSQERQTKAELAVLRWQKFNQQQHDNKAETSKLTEQITQQVAQQKNDDIALFTAKQQVQIFNDNIQTLQQEKITLTNDIARLEQHIKHIINQQEKLQLDKKSSQQQMTHAQQTLLTEQQQAIELKAKLAQQQPELARLSERVCHSQEQLKLDNEQLVSLQKQWSASIKLREAQTKQQLQSAKQQADLQAEIKQSQTRLAEINLHLTELTEQSQKEYNQAANEQLAQQLLNLTAQLEETQLLHHEITELLEDCDDKVHQLTQQKSEKVGTHKSTLTQIEYLQKQLSQHANWQIEQQQWLKENNLTDGALLQEKLVVESGWELALEVVMSHYLQSACLTDLPFGMLEQSSCPTTLLLLQDSQNDVAAKQQSLAEKISGSSAINVWLNTIIITDNVTESLALLPQLSAEQSVICRQGIWLGHHFIRKGIIGEQNEHFNWQNELASALQSAEQLVENIAQIDDLLLEQRDKKQQLLAKQQAHKNQLHDIEQNVSQEKQQAAIFEQAKKMLEQRLDTLAVEKTQLVAHLEQLTTALSDLVEHQLDDNESADTVLDKSQHVKSQHLKNNKLSLEDNIAHLQQSIQTAQQQHADIAEQKHQMALLVEKSNHQLHQHQQNIVRFQESIEQLTTQQRHYNQQFTDNSQPLNDDQQQLQLWLQQMSDIDQQLQDKRAHLADDQITIKTTEQKQRQLVENIEQLRAQLNQLQLDGESSRLKAQNALEQLNELGKDVKSVEQNLPENARESQWQAQLIKLGRDLSVLGAINLAAIDEFESQLTRKNYLDQQDQDLNLAISTLESAIEKIDKESRQKFKATFDKVNEDLQRLFPKVFGGGQAYLTLTGDDLLDTGITIMARPPGKKNSTIHLLSGGEKALTALSLVFAIFRLNPAPFCMLDEVDAPLDDANVGRFCNLVREMSQTVQFIYISHNKIAMEMATHLTGVTMVEAGVSRLVAVDIDEAVAMADVS